MGSVAHFSFPNSFSISFCIQATKVSGKSCKSHNNVCGSTGYVSKGRRHLCSSQIHTAGCQLVLLLFTIPHETWNCTCKFSISYKQEANFHSKSSGSNSPPQMSCIDHRWSPLYLLSPNADNNLKHASTSKLFLFLWLQETAHSCVSLLTQVPFLSVEQL